MSQQVYYLLALAQTVQADYLLTGDDDLLVLNQFGMTQIMRFADFLAFLARQPTE